IESSSKGNWSPSYFLFASLDGAHGANIWTTGVNIQAWWTRDLQPLDVSLSRGAKQSTCFR
ncbi:hypothetical protein AMECASPLE_014948, partial [Ameca splendens]